MSLIVKKKSASKKAAVPIKPKDALSRFTRASSRSNKRGVVRPPLLAKKEAKLAGGQTKYESPFPTGTASLSGQRYSLGQQPDAYRRDPQSTTAKRHFKKTSGTFPADYAKNVQKLGRSGLEDLSTSLKGIRTAKKLEPEDPKTATAEHRYQTNLAAILHDAEPLRGNLAKEGRGAINALAESSPKKRKALADVAEKDGVKRPKTFDAKDADHARWMGEVIHQAAPFTAEHGGSAHEELRAKKRTMTNTQAHIWESGYVSDSSDEDEPDPYTITARRKSAGLPALKFPSQTSVADAVKKVMEAKAKEKKRKAEANTKVTKASKTKGTGKATKPKKTTKKKTK